MKLDNTSALWLIYIEPRIFGIFWLRFVCVFVKYFANISPAKFIMPNAKYISMEISIFKVSIYSTPHFKSHDTYQSALWWFSWLLSFCQIKCCTFIHANHMVCGWYYAICTLPSLSLSLTRFLGGVCIPFHLRMLFILLKCKARYVFTKKLFNVHIYVLCNCKYKWENCASRVNVVCMNFVIQYNLF